MKFDVLIIGGGLAGLTCGIRLQKNGVKCAIVSTGQSALHFSSGSFDLLNELPDGTKVDNPMAAVGKVSANHPYANWVASLHIMFMRQSSSSLIWGLRWPVMLNRTICA